MQAPPRPRSPWAIYLKLIGGWLIAASVAVGNHFFFAMLDGRNTREFKDILITTIKNALAAVVQLTLMSVQGVAIVQIAWSFIQGKGIAIRKLNAIFTLPSAISCAELASGPSFTTFLPLLGLALTSLLMPAIPIFVPASLSIKPSEPIEKRYLLPALDLSKSYMGDIANFPMRRLGAISPPSVSARLNQVVQMTMGLASPLSWQIPQDCNFGCTYSFEFDSVAPKCTDIGPDDISTGANYDQRIPHLGSGDSGSATFYNATLIWSSGSVVQLIPYTLAIPYRDTHWDDETRGYKYPPAGTICSFHNATYTVLANFSSSVQHLEVTNLEFLGEPLTEDLDVCGRHTNDDDALQVMTSPCWITRTNTFAIIKSFSDAISGTVRNVAQAGWVYNTTYATSLFTSTVDGKTYSGWVLNNETASIGLSTAVERLFHNTTLSLMSNMINQVNFVPVAALVTPYATQYSYNAIQLVTIYAVYLALVGLSTAFGIHSLRKNGVESKNEFGSFLVATRNPEIDVVARRPQEEMEMAQLRYGLELTPHVIPGSTRPRKVFSVVENEKMVQSNIPPYNYSQPLLYNYGPPSPYNTGPPSPYNAPQPIPYHSGQAYTVLMPH